MDKKQRKALRSPYVHTLFQNNKLNFAMTVIASLLQSLGFLIVSWVLKEITDTIAGTAQYGLAVAGIVAAVAVVVFLVGWAIDQAFFPKFLSVAMKQYRAHVFEKLMGKGIQSFSNENTALYLSALSNDANVIEQEFLGKISEAVQVTVLFVGALTLMVVYSPLLTLVAIGLSLLPILVSILFGNKAAVAEKRVSDQKETYTATLKDVLSGFAVIKSFKAERDIIRLHQSANGKVAEATRQRTKVNIHIAYSSGIAGGMLQIGVFVIACVFALNGIGEVTAGTAIVFVQLLNYVLAPIQTLPPFYAGLKSSFSLMEKLAIELNRNVDDTGESIVPELNRGISIRNLSFAYDENKPVLHGVDLDLAAGGCYALVGGSGSGKSTLLNLLMASSRNYEGEIKYDDHELKNISSRSLYDLVSIIQQNVFVFNSTIKDNITMFSPFPEEELARAITMSGLGNLVEEKGADYLCGENGSGLSGGERQRISIARALLRKTPILFVDEATSSLDAQTSFEVLDAITNLRDHTRVIVTHDLDENILRRCTGLFVLRNGTIIERGNFESLMKQKGYFYSLFTVSQTE